MALDRRPPSKPAPASKPSARGGASELRVGWRDRLDAALDHHRASARDAVRRLARQWFASSMTVLVIGIALSLPAVLYVVLDNVRALAGHWEGQAQVSLFLARDVDDAGQRALAARLGKRGDVSGVRVITRDQALAEFRAQSGYGDVLDALGGENPLPGVLVVTPRDAAPAAAGALRDTLAEEKGVDLAQLDSEWLQKLDAMLAIGDRIARALALGFALAVLLVVVNTIRLGIEARRDEVVVVKLVGATDAFVRRPFLYTGLWFGFAGGIAAAGIVAGLVAWVAEPVGRLVSLYGSTFSLAGLGVAGSLALPAIGALLGLAGAWVAVTRHLRDVEPR